MTFLIKDAEYENFVSAYVEARDLDEGRSALESEGYQIIPLEQNAKLRVNNGGNSSISRIGNWVSEGVIYVKGKGKFLTKKSPILARSPDQEGKNGNSLYINEEQIEFSLKDSFQISDKLGNPFSIPTKRFGEEEIAVFLFGDFAKDYGFFLKDAKIKNVPFWFADFRDKPFARLLWFDCMDEQSRIVGDGGSVGGFVRGIKTLDSVS